MRVSFWPEFHLYLSLSFLSFSFVSILLFFSSSYPIPLRIPVTIWCFHWLMTEGMVTRARAVDEQLSAIADQLARHDSVFSKIDSLCSTVQHHSDSFKLLRKSHSDSFDILRNSLAAQQTVMAEMMVKLQQLDKGSSSSSSHQPPLLPLPPSMPVGQINHPSPLNPPSIHSSLSLPTPRLPKIEVPFFSGDDVLGWLFQINHYFVFNQIPEDQRIAIAAFYMAGSAWQWFSGFILPINSLIGTTSSAS